LTTRATGLGQPGKQQHREREVAEVVHAEVQLEAISGQPPLAADAGVVHQHVQRLIAGQERRGAVPDRRERGQVERQQGDRIASGGGLDRGDRRRAALSRAAGDVHPSAAAR
jgi:hypothetical protein